LCLGIEDGKLAFIYETALKLRWRDIDGRHFCFAFGVPFIWRALPLLSPSLRSRIDRVYITEGETDCITLVDRGFEKADLSQICVAISGANQFKPEWASLLSGLNVTLVPDTDDAGRQALGKWTELLAPHVKSLRQFDLSRLERTDK
jgi:hypothetical protein